MQIVAAQNGLESCCLRPELPDSSGSAEHRHELGSGESCGRGRSRRGGQQCASLWTHQAAAFAGERSQQGREVLVKQAAESVVRDHPVPDGILLGASEYRDRLDLLTVVEQPTVGMQVGAQDVSQDQRVTGVGFLAGDAVSITVAGHGQRVDGEHRSAARAQARHQQAAAGLKWLLVAVRPHGRRERQMLRAAGSSLRRRR
jgi:hypothetical protein